VDIVRNVCVTMRVLRSKSLTPRHNIVCISFRKKTTLTLTKFIHKYMYIYLLYLICTILKYFYDGSDGIDLRLLNMSIRTSHTRKRTLA
jgi:ubiquinone/menaquinone biosynthesis C-methylase UbiE